MNKNFATATKTWLGGVVLGCFAVAGQAWAADIGPDAMVQKVAGETLAQIKADASLQTGDPSRIVALIDRNVMPHVNFTRLTGTAVGPAWRTATPEQKKRLEQEFKTLLARTYAGAFKLANDKELKVLPLRGNVPPELEIVGITRYCEIHVHPWRIIYEALEAVVHVHWVFDSRWI